MNTSKWVQLVCSFVLVLLPAAIQYRNWRHNDRRTKVHRWITMILLALWIVAGSGLAWVMWKEFSRKEKAPTFAFYLNGIRIEKTDVLTLPMTNDSPVLIFTVSNEGDLAAERLVVHLTLPTAVTVANAEGWTRTGIVQPSGNTLKPVDTQAFVVEDESRLEIKCFFGCPPLSIQSSNLATDVNQLFIWATASDGTSESTWAWLKFRKKI